MGDICDGVNPNIVECSRECPQYVQNVFTARKLESSQLQTLTIMVGITTVMTCLVLVILSMMMMLKFKKRRRLAKKVLPSTIFNARKEDVSIHGRNKFESLDPKMLEKTNKMPVLDSSISMSTFVTQVSKESSDLPNNSPNQLLQRPEHMIKAAPRRLPSDDCVAQNGRCQPYESSAGTNLAPRQYSEVV